MTEKRFEEQNLENHLNRIYDAKKGKVVFDEDIVDLLNALHEEKEYLKTRFHEERELAMRLGRECDTLTIKKHELELEIIRLERIIKTGEKKDEHIGWKRVDVE